LYGNGRIAEYAGATPEYYLGDALGSVRQLTTNTGGVTLGKMYQPYGSVMSSVGSGASMYGYTGEQTDATNLIFLRARYYASGQGRFISKDSWPPDYSQPHSLNAWNYTMGNPINYVDPSGYHGNPPFKNPPPKCPVGRWDCEAVKNVFALKQAFLDSAVRHNKLPNMDDNGFAALLAATIVSERRIGNIPTGSNSRNRRSQQLENLVASFGCTVSGGYIKQAADAKDIPQLLRYLTNQDVPQRATVGIGNVWLETAANLWHGQACSSLGDCTAVQVSELAVASGFGWDNPINNPFGPQQGCALMGVCGYGKQSETDAYVDLTLQLLDNRMNIEYVAANMEAGALRAIALGFEPSAFNSASWHLRGLQTNREIEQAGWNPGGAIYILDDIPTALTVLGLTSAWSLNTEPQYDYWKNH
jgi:RHS repeat-associated protein